MPIQFIVHIQDVISVLEQCLLKLKFEEFLQAFVTRE